MLQPPDNIIRVLVVDDEPLARGRVVKLLRQRPGFEIIGECGNGAEAVEAIRRDPPDLLLLDVQMPEMNGFEVIETVGTDAVPAVIFVTAYDQHALRAFELHALDYLLKPYDDERFDRALQRARARVRRGQIEGLSHQLLVLLKDLRGEDAGTSAAPPAEEAPRWLERLAVKTADRVALLKVDEIDWIEGAGVYVQLHVKGKRHLHRETLSNLEQQLDPSRFVRIHRSTIVNVERVKELVPYFHGEYVVVLNDATKLKLSRSYRDRLPAILGKPE
jgi:two-component system, LytTR family, response regulator